MDFRWGDKGDNGTGLDDLRMGGFRRLPGLAGVGSVGPTSLEIFWVDRASIIGLPCAIRFGSMSEIDTKRGTLRRGACKWGSMGPLGQKELRTGEKRGCIPLRFPSTLPKLSSWRCSNDVAGREIEIEELWSLRVPREVCGRDIADAGREPYPTVLEKAPLAGREVVEPGRDVVEEA